MLDEAKLRKESGMYFDDLMWWVNKARGEGIPEDEIEAEVERRLAFLNEGPEFTVHLSDGDIEFWD